MELQCYNVKGAGSCSNSILVAFNSTRPQKHSAHFVKHGQFRNGDRLRHVVDAKCIDIRAVGTTALPATLTCYMHQRYQVLAI